jgi:excisionase family DNA binding protein
MPAEEEAQALKELERILRVEGSQTRLVGGNGEQITIPNSVYQVLLQVIQAMASGQAISIVPLEREMTTQQAADFLNVSRPYLIKLLEQGEIRYTMVGSHRRVFFEDLLRYKEQRDLKRDQLLKELTQMSQEAGFYE